MATKRSRRAVVKEVAHIKKVAHNVVECRRKQRISQSVEVLSRLVTPCDCGKKTRAEILQKAVDKIQELERVNKELQEIINGQTHDGTNESLLQTKLALTVLEHLHLMLSIIDHNERSKSTTVTVTATTGTVKSLSQEKAKTITSERLGFAMENLLENTPTFERTHNHYFLQDTWQETSCAPVTIATQRTDIDSCLTNNHLELPSSTDHSSSSSSWHQHSSYYNNNPYYSLETSDWLPTLSQLPPLLHHHHHYNSTQTPLGSEGGGGGGRDEMESFDRVQGRPPMWRPYNDSQHHSHNTISLPLSPPPHSTANNTYNSHQQQPSTSFLVGELLDV